MAESPTSVPRMIDADNLLLSTGTSLYANCGIIGIDPDLTLSHGYDGPIYTPARHIEGEDIDDGIDDGIDNDLTSPECIELADYVIERWTKFKQKHVALLEKKA